MNIRKALLAKSLRELLTITACLSHCNKSYPTDIQKEEIRMSIKLPYVEGTTKNYGVYEDFAK